MPAKTESNRTAICSINAGCKATCCALGCGMQSQ